MTSQVIAPAAIVALKEALTLIYWYKPDLRSFLYHSLDAPEVLARLNWQDYKRNVVSSLVDYLARNQRQYQGQLLRLMTEVCRMEDFSHLKHIEDGENKARRAEKAVAALKTLVTPHEEVIAEQRAAEQRRQQAYERSLRDQAVRQELEKLMHRYSAMLRPGDEQQRGYDLEQVLNEVFQLFDLDPKEPFRVKGEQIDGAFTFESTDYLLETKWQAQPADTQDLDAFKGKITRKLDNTLGLFLSVNGFARNAVELHSTIRPVMILMDGSDLWAVLEGRIDLLQLLLRKRRHAALRGKVFLPIHQIL
jgi:hypothetical protein